MTGFVKAALIRAVRTMAQAALAMIPAAATINDVDWVVMLQTASLAGIVSIITSLAFDLPEAPKNGGTPKHIKGGDVA
jgi:hypothetical protein